MGHACYKPQSILQHVWSLRWASIVCGARIAIPGTNQGYAMSAHVMIIAILVTNVTITKTSLHMLRHVTTVMDEMLATACPAPLTPLSSERLQVNFVEDADPDSNASSDVKNLHIEGQEENNRDF